MTQAPISRCSSTRRRERLRNCSGAIIKMPTSPSRIRSNMSARSGIDSKPLIAAQQVTPRASRPATWSAINATNGEMTTVNAPVFSYRDKAGI